MLFEMTNNHIKVSKIVPKRRWKTIHEDTPYLAQLQQHCSCKDYTNGLVKGLTVMNYSKMSNTVPPKQLRKTIVTKNAEKRLSQTTFSNA